MMNKKVRVPLAFLEQTAALNCCGTLDMHTPAKSKGQVIEWKRQHWVCVGSSSRHLHTLTADLRQVVPVDQYDGPPPDPEIRGHDYYTGGHLWCRGQEWVMTNIEFTLIPLRGEIHESH